MNQETSAKIAKAILDTLGLVLIVIAVWNLAGRYAVVGLLGFLLRYEDVLRQR